MPTKTKTKTTKKRKSPRFPIFDKYTVPWLHEQTGYALRYLQNIRWGGSPVTPRFRKMVALVLGESEEALFGKPARNGSRPKGVSSMRCRNCDVVLDSSNRGRAGLCERCWRNKKRRAARAVARKVRVG